MGVKVYSERRYSAEEKVNTTNEDLMRCNTQNAIKAVGFQFDKDSDACKNKKLFSTRLASSKVRNVIVSAYGTYAVKNGISDWQKQIRVLALKKKLSPRVLKRELVLILRFVYPR